MAVNDSNIGRFKYRRDAVKIYFALLLIAWILIFIAWPIWSRPEEWMSLEKMFSIPGFVILLILFINFYLTSASIEVDDQSIYWVILNWRWKEIKWHDVECIGVSSVWNYAKRKRILLYSIYTKNRRRMYFMKGGAIFFDESICGIEQLKDRLRSEAEKRAVRIEGGHLD